MIGGSKNSILYLHMSLRLHEATHHPETGKEVARRGVCGHSWNDGVIRPLARSQSIGMRRVQ